MSDAPKPHPPEAPLTTLEFNPDTHTYRLDGKSIRGVTGLIGAGLPKDQLIPWAGEQAGKLFLTDPEGFAALAASDPYEFLRQMKSAHRNTRDKAARTGTAVHRGAEQIHRDGEAEVDAEVAPYLEGYSEFLDRWQIEPMLVERPCGNRKDWFAGTLDLIAKSPLLCDGKPVLIDIKSSGSVHGDMALQLAAYAKAEFYVDEDGYERHMPKIHGTFIAHTTPMDREGDHERYGDRPMGTSLYQFAKSPAEIDTHYQWFLAAAFTAKTARFRQKLVSEPLELPTKEASDA